jgi:hypothetical protein
MNVWARMFVVASIFAWSLPAWATDQGKYGNVPDHIRSWFKSVQSPKGVPCCDIADGHRTDYNMRADEYWVPIDGEWLPVPAEAIVYNAGNPVGEAIVWYTKYNGKAYIRCFVPGGGV